MFEELNISNEILGLATLCEQQIKEEFQNVDEICNYNSLKVLSAFLKNKVAVEHFNGTTGYGYNDIGRDTIENVYKTIFKTEDALVRNQIISGTHALTVTLFGLLRPNDTLLSITGKPYDTLDEVIGIKACKSSLKEFDVNYEQIELINNDFAYEQIKERLKKSLVKVILIQRSKGYANRKSISIEQLEKCIKFIKEISPNTIIMIDNCYCEFVTTREPSEVGADITVGSLIKNLGGGLVPNGGYIVGKKHLIDLVAERLNVPGIGKEIGPSITINKLFLQGLFMAPKTVSASIKVAIFTSKILESLGYEVEPKYDEKRVDIVQSIIFNNEEALINYCDGIQSASPIDSFVKTIPSEMPGYSHKVIMAAGTFTQGSSIELSCDGPIKPPFIAYQQGSLTYEYGKLAVMKAITRIKTIL